MKYCKAPTKESKVAVNATIKDLTNALLLSVNTSIDFWMLDLGPSFHTTNQHNTMENCIVGDHNKVDLDNGEPLDIVSIDDVDLKISNGQI